MEGTIQNRDQFLNTIANRLGRARLTSIEPPQWKYQPQYEVFKDATQDKLVDILEEMCNLIHTKFYKTDKKELPNILNQVVTNYGGGPILTWKDKRFEEWGLGDLFHKEWPSKKLNINEWDYKKGEENIQMAERPMWVLPSVKLRWLNLVRLLFIAMKIEADPLTSCQLPILPSFQRARLFLE